jgi:hypothetical protein
MAAQPLLIKERTAKAKRSWRHMLRGILGESRGVVNGGTVEDAILSQRERMEVRVMERPGGGVSPPVPRCVICGF